MVIWSKAKNIDQKNSKSNDLDYLPTPDTKKIRNPMIFWSNDLDYLPTPDTKKGPKFPTDFSRNKIQTFSTNQIARFLI